MEDFLEKILWEMENLIICRVLILAFCMLLLMSKLTAKAYGHPINPYRTIIWETKNKKNNRQLRNEKEFWLNAIGGFLALAGFFISGVEATRLYLAREAAKASVLGFDDARTKYKWVQPINIRNGFSRFLFFPCLC